MSQPYMTPRFLLPLALVVLAGCQSTTSAPTPFPNNNDEPGAPQPPRTVAEMRARVADLQARADAGDPNVRVYSKTTTNVTRDPEEARARADEMRARLAVELTPAEVARRQAYVDAHPSLPPQFKEMILSGMFAPAMRFDEVEQIVGRLQPVANEGGDAQTQTYLAEVGAGTMRLQFIDGKLARWTTMKRTGG